MKAKQQAVQWIDGSDKTGSNGVGDEDLGGNPGEDKSVGEKGVLQLKIQELELEQQSASQERKKEIREAPPDPEEETREVPLDSEQETRGVSLDP